MTVENPAKKIYLARIWRNSSLGYTEERSGITSRAGASIFWWTNDTRHRHVKCTNRLCLTPKTARRHDKTHRFPVTLAHRHRALIRHHSTQMPIHCLVRITPSNIPQTYMFHIRWPRCTQVGTEPRGLNRTTRTVAQFAFFYLEEIAIFRKTIKQHIDHVCKILSILFNAGTTLKL